jgi:hypothetical protein
MLLMGLHMAASAQDCGNGRYLQNVFESSVTTDVVFGTSPALTAVYVAENVTVAQDMTMDIFVPVGDVLALRPAVVLAYGGGYLFGTKEDEDVWATCDSLAKKGYVTASINYRMNLNVADPNSAVRAIYRAAQDYSSAIRYLKHHAADLRIDTSYVFAGGVSAGGFSALHMMYLDEDERPAATFQSGLFGVNPDLGCLDCVGNSYPESHHVRGLINLWGALMDANYIDAGEAVPMTLFHGTDDLIVPYGSGFPFTALFLMPEVDGSSVIQQRLTQIGMPGELNTFEGVGHNIWGVNVANQLTPGPTEHWTPITDSIISFLYEHIRPAAPDFAAPATVCAGDTVILTATALPVGGRACWTTDADILSANADSSQITALWTDAGAGYVSVSAVNHLQAVSVPVAGQVNVLPSPAVTLTADGNQLTVDGVASSFVWYLDGQLLPATGPTLTATVPGTYTVVASGGNGCTTSVSASVTVISVSELIRSGAARPRPFDLLGRDSGGVLLRLSDGRLVMPSY